MKGALLIVTVASMALLAGCSCGRDDGDVFGFMDGQDIRTADDLFLTQAAQGSAAEIEWAELALDRSRDPQVRQYAQRMIQDHQAVTQDLRRTADMVDVSVPSSLSASQAMVSETLDDLDGRAFDTQYVGQVLASHARQLELFEHASLHAENPQVRSFAAQHIGDLQSHLGQARRLHRQLGGTGIDRGMMD